MRVTSAAGITRAVESSPFFHWLDADNSPWFEWLDRDKYDGPFFNDLEAAIAEEIRISEKRARLAARIPQALHVLHCLRRIEDIDLYRMTLHMPPDFFGNQTQRFDKVKELYEKKARIVWHLKGLYMYLAFDEKSHNGWKLRNGTQYSKQRKVWFKLLRKHKENVEENRKQAKWDKKRQRQQKIKATKARKTQEKTLKQVYHLRLGLGNVPKV
jgi:hypothetical protein